MKPQRFEIGQAVTPNKKDEYQLIFDVTQNGYNGTLPTFGEIYHVHDYGWEESEWYISLHEFPKDHGFAECDFDPVISNSHLESDLREITEPVPEECVLTYAP